jgi:hypothetical protein
MNRILPCSPEIAGHVNRTAEFSKSNKTKGGIEVSSTNARRRGGAAREKEKQSGGQTRAKREEARVCPPDCFSFIARPRSRPAPGVAEAACFESAKSA